MDSPFHFSLRVEHLFRLTVYIHLELLASNPWYESSNLSTRFFLTFISLV